MPTTLFAVYGSHPCDTVQRALEIKGVAHRTVEWTPPVHAPAQKLLFGRRTVPGVRFADGERVSGSRAILRRLDERYPEPALLPAEPGLRARVLEAERWGDELLQPIPRRVLWWALGADPTSIPSYQEHAKLRMPAGLMPLITPMLVPIEHRLNRVTDAGVRADLADLPGMLDRIDDWLGDGTLGGPTVNAADLQIAPSLRLLMTLDDLRGPIESRPAGQLALRLFPDRDGHVPAGTFPEEWMAPLRG